MTFFNSGLDNYPEKILCFYINATSRIQLIRMTNLTDVPWERVIFLGQRLLFEAVPSAQLEIHTDEIDIILIPCPQLRVNDKSTASKFPSLSFAS